MTLICLRRIAAATAAALVLMTSVPVFAQQVFEVGSAELIRANSELDAEQLLDIGIILLDPGIPEDRLLRKKENIFPEVRNAESWYLPYLFRNTLTDSGQWGAARVLPEADSAMELAVTGRILKSDGIVLLIQVEATDSTGRQWINQQYLGRATADSYNKNDTRFDPFQHVFNQIANDLVAFRSQLSSTDMARIQQVSQLRYAAVLSPQAFGQHLTDTEEGIVQVNRLPAENDPMFARVMRIRESEYLFIDTVDQHYKNFYQKMAPTYWLWRRVNSQQLASGDQIRKTAGKGKRKRRGSYEALKDRYQDYSELKLHQDTMRELAETFNAQVEDTAVELDGQLIKLNGTLDTQYSEWRRLLKEIFDNEVGLPSVSG